MEVARDGFRAEAETMFLSKPTGPPEGVEDFSSSGFWNGNVKINGNVLTKLGWCPDDEFTYLYFSRPVKADSKPSRPVKLRAVDVPKFLFWLKQQVQEMDDVGETGQLTTSLARFPDLQKETPKDAGFWDSRVVTFKEGHLRGRTYYDAYSKVFQIHINNEVCMESWAEKGWFGPFMVLAKGNARRLIPDLENYVATIKKLGI